MPAEEERTVIGQTLATIAAATGTRPRGWLGAGGGESWHSLESLAAEGVRYVADWINDDQPYRMEIGAQELISIPYSGEINDAAMIVRRNLESEEFGRMIRRQFDVLHAEGQKTGKVMCIALHPWIIGVPHRIGALIGALDHIASHPAVWFATGSEIVDAYLAQAGGDRDNGEARQAGRAQGVMIFCRRGRSASHQTISPAARLRPSPTLARDEAAPLPNPPPHSPRRRA